MADLLKDLAEVNRLIEVLPKDGRVSVSMYGDAQRAQIAAYNFIRAHAAEIEANARDAARLSWLMHRITGKELRRIGVNTGGPDWRDEIDAAMRSAKGDGNV